MDEEDGSRESVPYIKRVTVNITEERERANAPLNVENGI